MAFTAFHNMKPFQQLMFSLFVILVSFLIFMVISILVAIPFIGLESLMNITTTNGIPDTETINLLKYLQIVQSFGLFIVPPIILGWLFYGKISEYLFLNKSLNLASVLLVLIMMFFAAPFINFIGELNANMTLPNWLSEVEQCMKNAEENAELLTKAFLKVDTAGGLLFNIFMIAMLPAIGEELLFRGVIQRIFINWKRNNNWGIWISAILFSALHMQFYGFVPRMLLGVLFGYLLIWSGSMWLPIIAHFLNNAIAIIGIFLVDNNMVKPEIEVIGSTSGSYYLAAISLGLIVTVMLMIKRQNNGNEIQVIKIN